MKTFLFYLERKKVIKVEEFLYSDLNSADGYVKEIVIPYVTTQKNSLPPVPNIDFNGRVGNFYNPLSEWVYFKIYVGEFIGNKLLLDIIPDLINELEKRNIISKWFFVRYSDPMNHLRVRFLLNVVKKKQALLDLVEKYLANYLLQNVIWNLQICTYIREIERYGNEFIESAESWFYHNSKLAIKLLPIFKQLNDQDQIVCGAYCLETLLDHFSFTLEEKHKYVFTRAELFAKEFNLESNKESRFEINELLRKCSPDFKKLFDADINKLNVTYKCVYELLRKSRCTDNKIITSIREKSINNDKFTQLIADFLHMFINRLFFNEQRFKEMKIYKLM
jgi:thiopeptide-type bacteriocin biosynthesis protein